MESALSSACLEKIRAASKPMSFREISAACLGREDPNAKQKAELTAALENLTARAEIYKWPPYKTSQLFYSHSLQDVVEKTFIAVLDTAPLTVSKANGPVSRIVGKVSQDNVLTELRRAAPKLAAARQIVQIPINRQTVAYMSLTYLENLAPTKSKIELANAFDQLILSAVKNPDQAISSPFKNCATRKRFATQSIRLSSRLPTKVI
jgi:hypothetical protein